MQSKINVTKVILVMGKPWKVYNTTIMYIILSHLAIVAVFRPVNSEASFTVDEERSACLPTRERERTRE